MVSLYEGYIIIQILQFGTFKWKLENGECQHLFNGIDQISTCGVLGGRQFSSGGGGAGKSARGEEVDSKGNKL